MVAASKLRKAQDAILLMRPYVNKLNGILKNATASLDKEHQSVFSGDREVQNVLIVVITSDRGLCGAFNTNVLKSVLSLIQEKYSHLETDRSLWILPIGKKGFEYFKKRNYQVIDNFSNIYTDLSFEKVREAAEFAMNGFLQGAYDRVEIVYNEFKNVATQILKKDQFLPLIKPEVDISGTNPQDFIFEPSVEYILEEMIPRTLKVQFYKSVLESNASEHGARMTAMNQATENAGELLHSLKLVYNRTRQAAITTEILEIVGGAEALENG